jgi:hypothetical protein
MFFYTHAAQYDFINKKDVFNSMVTVICSRIRYSLTSLIRESVPQTQNAEDVQATAFHFPATFPGASARSARAGHVLFLASQQYGNRRYPIVCCKSVAELLS